jgi:uncharacterized protein
MKEKLIFKKYDGTLIKDVHEYVKYWVQENPHGLIIIGCDSQEHSRYIKYAASIIMHMIDAAGQGHGGHVISATIIDTNKKLKSDIFAKLWFEAEITIEVAKLIGNIGVKPEIHLDYNSDARQYSNVLCSAGKGYVNSMGYECKVKPESFGASHISDKIAKSGRK